jgi:hypothetical protein
MPPLNLPEQHENTPMTYIETLEEPLIRVECSRTGAPLNGINPTTLYSGGGRWAGTGGATRWGWGRSGSRGSLPHRSRRRGRHEAHCESGKDTALRTAGRQVDTDAGGVLDDAGTDLDQAQAQRGELAARERARARQPRSQAVHEPVGRRVQDEAHLVGWAVAGRAVRGELALCSLIRFSAWPRPQ